VSFWQLALPELAVPAKAYSSTIARLEVSIARLDSWTGLRSLSVDWVDAYRSNRMELSGLVDKLKAEQQEQEKLVTTAAARLDGEKNHWFPGTHTFLSLRSSSLDNHLIVMYRENCDSRETTAGRNVARRLLLSPRHLQHSRCLICGAIWSLSSRLQNAKLFASPVLRRGKYGMSRRVFKFRANNTLNYIVLPG